MQRKQSTAHEDQEQEVETRLHSTDGPAESTLKRFQPSAELFKRVIRRPELRRIVPLADTTIYEMEQRGEFPKRFFLSPRCVVWDLAEVEAWLDNRRHASETNALRKAPAPNVRLRRARPIRGPFL